MCNRYRAASVVRIRDVFGFTYIESGPPLYRTNGIGPWQTGPFLRAGSADIGQWGLIPWFSATKRPTGRAGRPISTTNCRIETAASAPTFKGSWLRGQRCIIPAEDFDEPYWGTGKNIWWRFRRADGMPWGLAGLWSEWRDPQTGELILSYTMLTQNCDGHPVLGLMHKPDPTLPANQQDKRSVVPLEAEHWQQWLNGSRRCSWWQYLAPNSFPMARPTRKSKRRCRSDRIPRAASCCWERHLHAARAVRRPARAEAVCLSKTGQLRLRERLGSVSVFPTAAPT